MSAETITDAEVVEAAEPSQALTVRETPLSIVPHATADELGQRLALIKQCMANEMVEDVDYGVIPGTNKPTLLKPGAEKLSVLFRLDVQYETEKLWQGDHLTVFSHATVYDQLTGARLGAGEGACSTREKKYGKRTAQLECPNCGKPTVFKSKKEDEGWYCWRKKDGCGAQFPPGDERIASQKAGEVENPDLPDTWNTVIKMAKKRALIDAVLVTTAASAIFTQDVEESVPVAPTAVQGPPLGVAANMVEIGPALGVALKNLVRLPGEEPTVTAGRAKTLSKVIKHDCGGYFPKAAAIALIAAADTDNLVPDIEVPDV